MTLSELYLFNGSSIQMQIDGKDALGILFFAETGEVYVTSLCYLEPGRECPVIQHVLSDEEMQSVSRKSHNQLLSKIQLSTRPIGLTLAEEIALRRKDDELLLERMRRVNERSWRLIEQSHGIQQDSAAAASAARARMREPGQDGWPMR